VGTTSATIEPAVVSNPTFIVCDTDALVQLFLVDEILPFRELIRRYHVQPVIVEAVDVELLSPRGKRLKQLSSVTFPKFDKAKNNGTLAVLDAATLSRVAGQGASALYDQINLIGAQYHRRVDYGEAYSHAAGSVLKAPVLTHDRKARSALERDGAILGSPLLRVFDLLVMFHQCGDLPVRRCDEIRQKLQSEGEWLPDAFFKRSFGDGLPYMYARILDAELSAVGSLRPVEIDDVRLLLKRP
jgi:hypothetical protein